MTHEEYLTEIEDIVQGILDEVETELLATREDVEQSLWETIDGHSYVIYTSENHDVLKYSNNDAYSIDNFGGDSVVRDGYINWAALAFGAFYADVSEELWPRYEELLEEMEDDDEDDDE